MSSLRIAQILAATVLLAGLTSAALANGGGGGGGGEMPSMSAPQYDPAVEYQKGVAALDASRFAEARRAFDNVLAVAPKDANSAFLAGVASDALDKPKDAKRYYERAVKNDGERVDAHRGLALALVKLADRPKAQAQLDWLTAKATACAGTCANAAAIDAAIKDIQTALAGQPSAALRLELPRAPTRQAGDLVYGEAVGLINEHRYDAALVTLRQAGLAFGPHPDVLTYLGFTYRKLGDRARAQSFYRQALEIAPDHRGVLEYFGELKVEHGDMAGARANLSRLEQVCRFGCYEAEELRRWIVLGHDPSA
jgi:tetratricopeptide (TPR) repeat protein